MSFVPFLPLFVEFKKDDRRVVVVRRKSTISRLPLDVCPLRLGHQGIDLTEIVCYKTKLEHEKEDELVAVVVKGGGMNTLGGSGGESFWEEGDDFGVDVLRFHTCLTDILGFLEKLEWWFEQDINDEGEEDEEDGGGDEV
ncbi:hypothetical protein Tco_1073464 [Tanacetum coccineum]